MGKEDVVYIYINTHTHTHTHTHTMDYYSAIKKNEILPFVRTWMDLKGIILSEISQWKINTMWFQILMWNLKNKWTNRTETGS